MAILIEKGIGLFLSDFEKTHGSTSVLLQARVAGSNTHTGPVVHQQGLSGATAPQYHRTQTPAGPAPPEAQGRVSFLRKMG